MEYTKLHSKISSLPPNLKSELNDFVDFLLQKRRKEIKKKQPIFGCADGDIYMSPDFDETLRNPC
ncbi:MAG: DUF2281 domain-containing protein [Bacteroidota bacterium]|nr:DUF2281 domain-containing protein [Bacteroidota bacterium]